jgi:hypothetical protein
VFGNGVAAALRGESFVLKNVLRFIVLAGAVIVCTPFASTQTSPTPGPTNPAPQPNPLAKPGSDLVINPTTEECKQGWRPGLKWTKEQFEKFCTEMKTAK